MNRLVEFSLRQRLLIVGIFAAMLVAGAIGFWNLNIEAYPDPVPPMVEVITQTQGLSAEEMERNVTIPIEVGMAGIPHLTAIRAISLFGLSDIKIQFSYDLTNEGAKQQVINRLSQLPPLAGGAQPTLSPTSPVGEIYRYKISAPPGYSVMDLKTLQDWVLQRRFKRIPGVIDVTGWGGKLRTYDVVIDNDRLAAQGVSVGQVLAALGKSDGNVGGQTINFGAQAAIVRGVGLIQSVSAIQNVLVGTANGQPILLKNVAHVEIGNAPRLGIAGYNNEDDIVQGIVLMQRGAQSMPTIEAVQKEVADINASGILPPGVHLDRIYDRSDLIHLTIHTVLENLVAGIALIFFLQWAFLGNLRSAIIVAATIPFALAFAILILVLQGESANLLSVGALDFGLVVDASVIMVENIFRHMVERSAHVEGGRGHYTLASRFSAVLGASHEVSRGIFFAAAIIIASFLPLFTLTGVEGHIFGPMAKTYAYAITGGLIATFTVAPVLATMLLPDKLSEVETWIVARLRRLYEPAAAFALGNRILAIGGVLLLLGGAMVGVRSLGIEFLPHLEEGNMYIRASLPASISLEAGQPVVDGVRRMIAQYPEVESVLSAHGRPDDGTDSTGFFNAEFFVPLKPTGSWPAGVTKETLTAELSKKLQAKYPGVDFSFSQYIEDNVEEAASGVKGANSIKLFGPDLPTLEKYADAIKAEMAKVKGIEDLGVFQSLGQPTVRIDVDRARASRYGLTPDDINATVAAAIGGQSAADLYEKGTDRHFPIVVRLKAEQRDSLDAIRRITVGAPSPNGNGTIQVPLSEVADIKLTSGASFIYREHQERYIPIKFSVRGRDLGGAVEEARARITRTVHLPPGYHLEWAGELDNLTNAVARLEVVVPISLLLILLLLYANFGSIRDSLLAFSAIPMAIIGGVLALALTGTAFSISSAIGFVALFGIAVMDGILVVTTYNHAIDEYMGRQGALATTVRHSLRPVVMTCLVAAIGLLPAAISNGIGSQVQKPLALVVVGGMTLAPLLILLVLPVLIDRFSRRVPPGDRGAHGRDVGHHPHPTADSGEMPA
ncbi:cobalt-zinc-cadmium resistance protein CzcA [Sphingomonas sp. BE270]|jgi:cobalt-zinc-cadmium resistance protein CzcA|uniref:efflux RND transporter permease subunit n=1 Tax=unclassified Sphingomonas TaxID=196159 RepID=UPI0010F7CB42|nr:MULTISPECIES: CusA/CzcA family heavy metal efflux RND transporter [unclassified Sphingomonas]MDR6850232.1 cobalt-zinc-cadmium resistance protein CzcA [Sphingomonas sp. BE137]MDR7257166.1 cobalt-zinc-cadmium resistance protein CzcA [Sphingomonas sp. BE270]